MPQVQRLVVQSFLERDWSPVRIGCLSPAFVVQNLLRTVSQPVMLLKGQPHTCCLASECHFCMFANLLPILTDPGWQFVLATSRAGIPILSTGSLSV